MKRLFELLKSLKDWQKAGVIIGFIALIFGVIQTTPIIRKWFSPTPKIELYLGKIQLKESNPIVLHYFIPVDTKQWSKNMINFPLMIANYSEEDIKNFSIQIETETIETTGKGRVRRMFIEDSPYLKLKNIDWDRESNMQVLLNTNKTIPAISEFKDSINLNIIDMNPYIEKDTWDNFKLRITTRSFKSEVQEFNIEVCCHPMDKEPIVIDKIKSVKDKKTHVAINTVFQIGVLFKDESFSQQGGYYKVSRKEDSIRVI